MENITVDSTRKLFSFDKNVTDEFGEFFVIPKFELNVLPLTFSFSINEIDFITPENENISVLEFREQVLKNSYTPLNAFCAQAIWNDKDFLNYLSSSWWIKKRGYNTTLETMNFLGSMVDRAKNGIVDDIHVVCFKYSIYEYRKPKFMPFEAKDKAWSRNRDYALVFKKDFIENLKK